MDKKEKKTRNRVLYALSTLNEAKRRHLDDADYVVFMGKCIKTANEALEELEKKWYG